MSTIKGRLDGRVAIITGAASGIGAASARLFVEEGGHVVIADVADEAGQTLAAELGPKSTYVHLDVTSPEQWKDAVAVADEMFGGVDILVNNAGIANGGEIDDVDLDGFRNVLEVNLLGPLNGMKAVSEQMKRQGSGSIVNVSSLSGLKGWWHMHAYTASKFALTGLTRSAALDFGPYGVRVNSVHPGVVNTPMAQGRTYLTEHIALKRAGDAFEIAYLILFLASDESSYSTGAQFVADGGELAGRPTPTSSDEPAFVKVQY
jgi:3alpha(or 20beta)-hydroxysteroid dehydrogenase